MPDSDRIIKTWADQILNSKNTFALILDKEKEF